MAIGPSKAENPPTTVIYKIDGPSSYTFTLIVRCRTFAGIVKNKKKKRRRSTLSLPLLSWDDISLKLLWATTRTEPTCERGRVRNHHSNDLCTFWYPLLPKRKGKYYYIRIPGVKKSRLCIIRIDTFPFFFLFAQATLNWISIIVSERILINIVQHLMSKN